MKKLSSTLPNMLISLTGICLMAAAVLSFVNDSTKETIALSKIKALEAAIGEVTPAFDNKPLDEKLSVNISGDDLIVYPAKKEGTLVGAAIESVSHNGFSGDVKILVGIDTDGKIINYSVLQMSETPGLGDKMIHWFKTDKGGSPSSDMIPAPDTSRSPRMAVLSMQSPLRLSPAEPFLML